MQDNIETLYDDIWNVDYSGSTFWDSLIYFYSVEVLTGHRITFLPDFIDSVVLAVQSDAI